MSRFAAWLLGHRRWLALLAIVFVQFVPPVTCGLLIADAARQGPRRAAPIAIIVLAAVLVISLGGSGAFGVNVALIVCASFAAGTLLGRMLSLGLVFQLIVLAAMILALLVAIFGPSPAELAAPLIDRITEVMQLLGTAPEQIDVIRNWNPVLIIGTITALMLIELLAALMLGCWAWSSVEESMQFGSQFTSLRLGRLVGMLSIGAVTASLAIDWPPLADWLRSVPVGSGLVNSGLLQYLRSIAVVGFLFQGLAVMHAWARAKSWPWIAAAAVYAGLAILNSWVVAAVCAAGLLDNFFSLRRPLETGAS